MKAGVGGEGTIPLTQTAPNTSALQATAYKPMLLRRCGFRRRLRPSVELYNIQSPSFCAKLAGHLVH